MSEVLERGRVKVPERTLTPEDVDDDFCHLWDNWNPRPDGRPLCGADVKGEPLPHDMYDGQGVCSCGKPVCVRCRNEARL